jgi:hypothetical protein
MKIAAMLCVVLVAVTVFALGDRHARQVRLAFSNVTHTRLVAGGVHQNRDGGCLKRVAGRYRSSRERRRVADGDRAAALTAPELAAKRLRSMTQ